MVAHGPEQLTTENSGTNLRKAIGPGILVACAAIGGSHLVWSTRAGAEYGWSLVGLILLANLFKYPFFLYGQRYASATGESLLAGYYRKGVGYIYIFLLVNILTGAINIGGVSMLSGALLAGFGLGGLEVRTLTIAILFICTVIILVGHYKLLDFIAKIVIIILALTTCAAVALAFARGPVAAEFVSPSPWTWGSFAFLISLLGWMPAPVDLSAWSSLWMFSRQEQTGHFATQRETSIDFYLGYIMAVTLAVVFVALGKLTMFGSGETFSSSGIAFSKQLVSLYSANIGAWSRPLILSAAFCTMFSTTLTCVDGYPRSLAACCTLIGQNSPQRFRQVHHSWMIFSVISAGVIVLFFVKNLLQLLTFAAAISFVTSPILAFINFQVMRGENVPSAQRPGLLLMLLSWTGLFFFVLMTAGYLYVKLLR